MYTRRRQSRWEHRAQETTAPKQSDEGAHTYLLLLLLASISPQNASCQILRKTLPPPQ